jgi:Beta-lactamase
LRFLPRWFPGVAGAGVTALCVALGASAPWPAAAKTPPGGRVAGAPITAAELLRGVRADSLTRNARFAPPSGASGSVQSFDGTLKLAGAVMRVRSTAHRFIADPVGGKDTRFFPNVSITFFTAGSKLVPTTQDVIRNGVLSGTRSYWDIIVQPGRVWTQANDHGWHRASFPFALVNSIEGETHTGVALFLYRGSRVSSVRFQIVQETAPFDVPQYFTAWGTSAAAFTRGVAHLAADRRAFTNTQRAQLPELPWSALAGRAPAKTLGAFASYKDVIQSAAVIGGKIYRTDCPTAAGPFPYCSAVRYGVWSITKSAMLNVATLRLAEKFGSGFLGHSIAPYVPGAAAQGWSNVTFRDLANMASGHGPAGHGTCYLCDYTRWYLAPGEAAKTTEALNYPAFTKPGTKFNYRDQDAYLLGVADDNFLKSHEGSKANIWTMLANEVYRPIGISGAPTNSTIETPGAAGLPLMAYGYYPTLDDLAKIAMLYQSGGAWKGKQILDRALVDQLLPRKTLPKGALLASSDGSEHYLLDWHIVRVRATSRCTRYVPQAEGWGGNTLTLLPGGVSLLRMRNNWVATPHPQNTVNALASQLAPLCG